MADPVYKKIADLTASSDVQDSDQVWDEAKNDSTARNYTVLRSTMHIR